MYAVWAGISVALADKVLKHQYFYLLIVEVRCSCWQRSTDDFRKDTTFRGHTWKCLYYIIITQTAFYYSISSIKKWNPKALQYTGQKNNLKTLLFRNVDVVLCFFRWTLLMNTLVLISAAGSDSLQTLSKPAPPQMSGGFSAVVLSHEQSTDGLRHKKFRLRFKLRWAEFTIATRVLRMFNKRFWASVRTKPLQWCFVGVRAALTQQKTGPQPNRLPESVCKWKTLCKILGVDL